MQGKTADAITRGEEPLYGGLYALGGLCAPQADPCIANPPTKKSTKKAKPSSSHCKDG
jgi:hypothetical protein